MKMKAVLSVLLLAALTGAHAQFPKKYVFVKSSLSWTEAQRFCRRNYIDLAIVETEEEISQFRRDQGLICLTGCWIGLRWNKTMKKYIWADGSETSLETNSPSFPNACVYHFFTFYAGYCTLPLRFVCSAWDTRLVVVQETKTWEEALNYCRTNHTDLVNIVTEFDRASVGVVSVNIQTSRFWTGLRFLDGSWFWVNKTSSPQADVSFMPWRPAPPFRCGARSTAQDVLEVRDCEEKLNFICYDRATN